MSVILEFIHEAYSSIDEWIKEIDSHFMVGLLTIILWIVIVAIIYFAVRQWEITLVLIFLGLVIEGLCLLGRKRSK